jgi:RNA polymerase sigma factor
MKDDRVVKKENAVYDDAYILSITDSDEGINKFIVKHLPMVYKRASDFSKKYYTLEYDDIVAIIIRAFHEAIVKFPNQSGHFYPFVELVIKRRVLDEFRKDIKWRKGEVNISTRMPSDADDDGDVDDDMVYYRKSIENFEEKKISDDIAWEIERFEIDLAKHGITLKMLVKSSPKWQNAIKEAKEIAKKLYNNEKIRDKIVFDGQYPKEEIAELIKGKERFVVKFRSYIIAIVIIMTQKYSTLHDYIK